MPGRGRTLASMAKNDKTGAATVTVNRRARFDYDLGDRYEAGLALTGTEVKSLRQGKGSLAQAWVKVDERGEAWLVQAHIPEYDHGNRMNHDPSRPRKLLLRRHELEQLAAAAHEKGKALVPLKLYFRNGYAKLELAVGTGRAKHDKRRVLKERDAKREVERALRRFG